MFYEKTFCNFAILQFGDLWSIGQGIARNRNFYTIHTTILFFSRGAPSKLGESTEESGGFLRGKSDFTQRKVRDHEKPTKRLL